MNVAGLTPGAVLGLVREARGAHTRPAPVLVVGPLAAHLARSLAEGGDAGLVRTEGSVTGCSAFVCVLGGAPKPEQLVLLRRATRALVPIVGVQTGNPEAQVPYVLPADVVQCRPGEGFPVPEICAAIARGAGRAGASLAAHLPVLRPAVQRELAIGAAVTAAGIAAWPGSRNVLLPVLVPMQARLLGDLRLAGGGSVPGTQQELAATVGPEVGAALAVGLAARSVVRRLPLRNRVLEGLVAGVATYGLAASRRRI